MLKKENKLEKKKQKKKRNRKNEKETWKKSKGKNNIKPKKRSKIGKTWTVYICKWDGPCESLARLLYAIALHFVAAGREQGFPSFLPRTTLKEKELLPRSLYFLIFCLFFVFFFHLLFYFSFLFPFYFLTFAFFIFYFSFLFRFPFFQVGFSI